MSHVDLITLNSSSPVVTLTQEKSSSNTGKLFLLQNVY